MQHAYIWHINLNTYDHPSNDPPRGHDHSLTWVDTGFDIPDLK